MQLKYKEETRKGIIWVRITGGWFDLVDGKKKYQELQASTGIRKQSKPIPAEKLAISRLNTILTQLDALAASEQRQITRDEVRAKLIENEVITSSKAVAPYMAQPQAQDATVSKVIANYIDERKPKVSKDYLKIYATLQYYFERYDAHRGKGTTFKDFDASAFKAFWNWQDEVYKGKISLPSQGKGRGRTNPNGFAPDSIRKYQKAYYAVLDFAMHHNITSGLRNTRYERGLLIQSPAQAQAKKYLNVDEVQKIIDFHPTTKAEATARQYLIVGCLTGQRFQTMATLHTTKTTSQKGFKCVQLDYNKTKREGVIVPLFPAVLDAIKEGFADYGSNVQMNKHIKQVCERAGIGRSDEVTTHTVKRSFYSNLATADLPATTIQIITHPKRTQTAMQAVYDNREAITRATQFYNEVKNNLNTKQPYQF